MKLLVVCCSSLALLAPGAALSQSRGALLYDTHCIACHTKQVHWRQRRLATDWPSLLAQVWRWQSEAALGWNDDDVMEVARYLNGEFYHLPDAEAPTGRTADAGAGAIQSAAQSLAAFRRAALKR